MNKMIIFLAFCIPAALQAMEKPAAAQQNSAEKICTLPALVYYCKAKAISSNKIGPCGKEFEKYADLKCHLRKDHSLSLKHAERFSGIKNHDPRFDL